MRAKKHGSRKRSKRIITETLLSIAVLFAILIGSVAGYYGSKVMNFLDSISEHEPQTEAELAKNTEQIKNMDPFSVLILGIDEEDEGASRSDTIIVATLNPQEESMKMVSIPRDTFIELPEGRQEKINAAYASGGALLAREMVGSYLDIPLDFYAAMNFDGLVELVDAVDGITVRPEFEFTWDGHDFNERYQTIDGEAALAYSRMRKRDPRGDFGRQDRQKEVIESILDELNSTKSVTNFGSILDAVSPYLKTNARSEQMIRIASSYSSSLKKIDQLSIDGEGRMTYFPDYGFDLYIWEADELSLLKVQNELKEHLDIQPAITEQPSKANVIQ